VPVTLGDLGHRLKVPPLVAAGAERGGDDHLVFGAHCLKC
jgi:hypothetical protein